MNSKQSNNDKLVYHEKEMMVPHGRHLLVHKDMQCFAVTCPKALVNCLLQREAYKDDISLTISSNLLEDHFAKLNLNKYFNIHQLNQCLGKDKADDLGSIIALSEALTAWNITLSPVENVTYTSLVEKPEAFILIFEVSWVVIRNVAGMWYLIDPKSSAKNISETYLLMIVQQLILDGKPIYQVSGGEFSTLKRSKSDHLSQSAEVSASTSSSDRQDRDREAVESNPPDAPICLQSRFSTPHEVRVADSIDLLSNFCKLNLKGIAKRRGAIKEEFANRRERAQSATRPVVPNLFNSAGQTQNSDEEWPALNTVKQTSSNRRRARSNSRAKTSNQNNYIPPKDVVKWKKAALISTQKMNNGSENNTEACCCCICLESIPDMALYPCGHQCICANCKAPFLERFDTCPICKVKTTDAIRIFKV